MIRHTEYLAALLLCLLALPAQAERRDREQPIQLDAGRVLLDEAKQESVFEGGVRLTQGTLLIRAERITTREDGEGFQRISASGNPALFRQRYEGSDSYAEGQAARIEYDTRLEQVDFYGNARIRRGRDEISGGHIRYNTRTEVFEAAGNAAGSASGDGRVRAVIRPRATAPDQSSTPRSAQP